MKILAGFVEDGRHSGIDKYLLNFLDRAREAGHGVDFLTSVYDAAFAKELEEKGSRLYAVPNLRQGAAQEKAVKKILAEETYDLYYHNVSEPLNYPAAKAAKEAGVRVIWHSHSSGVDRARAADRLFRRAVNALCRRKTLRYSDKRLACSDKAAEWMYPKKVIREGDYAVIYNAVDLSRFAFSPEKREKARAALGLADEPALLFIGHFCYQKNNFFLLEILREVKKRLPRARLFCAGTGADEEAFRQKAEKAGLASSVRLLGVRRDTDALYSAADAFLLPSRFEGLPVVAAESAVSGLPVFLSDRVTRMARVTDRVRFLPLSASLWAAEIEKALAAPRSAARLDPDKAAKFDASLQKQQFSEQVFS